MGTVLMSHSGAEANGERCGFALHFVVVRILMFASWLSNSHKVCEKTLELDLESNSRVF